MVLSNLGHLFSWRFSLRENSRSISHLKRVGFEEEEEGEEQPRSKRQRVASEASGRITYAIRGGGEGSASRELVHILQKKKEAAEVRF